MKMTKRDQALWIIRGAGVVSLGILMLGVVIGDRLTAVVDGLAAVVVVVAMWNFERYVRKRQREREANIASAADPVQAMAYYEYVDNLSDHDHTILFQWIEAHEFAVRCPNEPPVVRGFYDTLLNPPREAP